MSKQTIKMKERMIAGQSVCLHKEISSEKQRYFFTNHISLDENPIPYSERNERLQKRKKPNPASNEHQPK